MAKLRLGDRCSEVQVDTTPSSLADSRAAPEPAVRPGWLEPYPWAAVGVLTALSALNYADRLLPAILAEPMKRELGLSDTLLGLLNGVGFLAIYGLAGLSLGRIADRGRHGQVISICVGLWSLMTALSGLVANGWQLVVARAGVAVGEAGIAPAAHAYISRRFQPEDRAAALAAFSLGGPLGGMASLIGGGVAAQVLGWRNTLLLMGVVGLMLAPFALLALGRGRLVADQGPTARWLPALTELRKPTVLALLAAAGFISMAGYACSSFAPAFLARSHGLSTAEVGLKLGLSSGLAGLLALPLVSWLGGWLSKRDARWSLCLLTATALAAVPTGVAAFRVADAWLATACISACIAVSGAYLPLTVGCLHSLVPETMRARTSAALMLCAAAFGGLGPLFTGIVSDALAPSLGQAALRHALLIVPASYAATAAFFLVAAATLRRDLERSRTARPRSPAA